MEETNEPIALEFAGFWRRLAAYLIDSIVLSIIPMMFAPMWSFGFGGVWNLNEMFDAPDWLFIPLVAIGNFVSFLVGAGFFIIFWKLLGQTPGKMVMGVKVIRTDGSALNWSNSILRYVGYMVSGLVLCLGFIWIAFDERKQGWHDKMADTYVVKVPKPPKPKLQQPQPSANAGV